MIYEHGFTQANDDALTWLKWTALNLISFCKHYDDPKANSISTERTKWDTLTDKWGDPAKV